MQNFSLIFLKKIYHGNKNLNEKLFLPKYLIDLEKKYQNQVTILIKKRFLPKFIFHQNFLFEKREKILTKQFFPIYLNMLEKLESCQVVEGTLFFQKKIQLGT